MNSNRKQKVLLITGLDAYEELASIDFNSLNSDYIFEIFRAPLSTVAFLSKKQLESILQNNNTGKYDYILVSGLIPWDLGEINKKYNIKIKKGPKFLSNLPEILKSVNIDMLSSLNSADSFMLTSSKNKIIESIEKTRKKILSSPKSNVFQIKYGDQTTIFDSELPPIIIAEIVDFPKLSEIELLNQIRHFIKKGADIIDLGCIANFDYSEKIPSMIKLIKAEFDIPISIDSLNPKEINAAINAGANMVLSVNIDNINEILLLPKDTVIVIIPYSINPNLKLKRPEDIISRLFKIEQKLRDNGFSKILLDPITNPPINPGLTPSLNILMKLNLKLKEYIRINMQNKPYCQPQLFMGFGNITELIDGDSSGINTLLSLIAEELNISAILTTEYSNKAKHSIEELKMSTHLAYYAKLLNQPPINLGITAFRLKSKEKLPKYSSVGEVIIHVDPTKNEAIMDPNGYFKIYIDEINEKIIVSHFFNAENSNHVNITFMGENAESLYKKILKSKLISQFDHAAYLGKELILAENALKLGLHYIQD